MACSRRCCLWRPTACPAAWLRWWRLRPVVPWHCAAAVGGGVVTGAVEPRHPVLLGWALLGQAMTGVSLVGMLVVLASILAVQWAMTRAALPAVR